MKYNDSALIREDMGQQKSVFSRILRSVPFDGDGWNRHDEIEISTWDKPWSQLFVG